jgi:RNA polymerase sigma-70 factor (ECF subfamily)
MNEEVAANSLFGDTTYIADLRRQMLRFASLQLGDEHLAEDAVQEALIGALKNVDSFDGRAAFKTWVYAILKNKITDTLRHKQRHVSASSLLHDTDEDDDYADFFDDRGHWHDHETPAAWAHPESSLQQNQFWEVFEACLEHLPEQQARVYMMREMIELESAEICEVVAISLSNLNVMLHRARLRLRECLEDSWFVKGEQTW